MATHDRPKRRRGARRDEQDDRGPEISREGEEGGSVRGPDEHDADGRREQYDPYFEEPELGRERDFESLEDWQRPRQLSRGGEQKNREGQRSSAGRKAH